jgi:hypothetical protein
MKVHRILISVLFINVAVANTSLAQETQVYADTVASGEATADADAQGPYDMLGAWTGSPACQIYFWQDDGVNVAGNCDNGSYDHEMRGSYIRTNIISGTNTRIDPNGCRTSVVFTITFLAQDVVRYWQQGWNGCGVRTAPEFGTWTRL